MLLALPLEKLLRDAGRLLEATPFGAGAEVGDPVDFAPLGFQAVLNRKVAHGFRLVAAEVAGGDDEINRLVDDFSAAKSFNAPMDWSCAPPYFDQNRDDLGVTPERRTRTARCWLCRRVHT
jgi:hypothetical protein